MTDIFSFEKRSWIMSRIKEKNTKPEIKVRSLIHRLGYRFRLHEKNLPGKPDLVFPSRKKIIFVHGCFWHGHNCNRGNRTPKTNTQYWIKKIERNKHRDKENKKKLKKLGWDIMVIWECELKKPENLYNKVNSFFIDSLKDRF